VALDRAGGPAGHIPDLGLASAAGRVPFTVAAANKLIAQVGVQISPALKTEAEIAVAHGLLQKLYKGVHTETLGAEVAYASSSRYEMRTASDRGASEPFGVASGWHLGPTGFQIDYLSAIEMPRKGQESRDITAGLCLMKQMATRHHAGALWVEVDPDMRAHYEKAGFKDFAQPHSNDPSQLTMMVLPLNNQMTARLRDDSTGLWTDHVEAWYKANWDSLKGPDAVPAREALELMRTDAAAGKRTWFQALPDGGAT
jgi:hypothetical protein